jgi:hypothetical protein
MEMNHPDQEEDIMIPVRDVQQRNSIPVSKTNSLPRSPRVMKTLKPHVKKL